MIFRTVFQSEIEGLKFVRDQLINEVVECIYYTVTARSVKYRSEVKTNFKITNKLS